MSALPELMYHLTYIVQTRYSGAVLNGLEFHDSDSPFGATKASLYKLGHWDSVRGKNLSCFSNQRKNPFTFGCRLLINNYRSQYRSIYYIGNIS